MPKSLREQKPGKASIVGEIKPKKQLLKMAYLVHLLETAAERHFEFVVTFLFWPSK